MLRFPSVKVRVTRKLPVEFVMPEITPVTAFTVRPGGSPVALSLALAVAPWLTT